MNGTAETRPPEAPEAPPAREPRAFACDCCRDPFPGLYLHRFGEYILCRACARSLRDRAEAPEAGPAAGPGGPGAGTATAEAPSPPGLPAIGERAEEASRVAAEALAAGGLPEEEALRQAVLGEAGRAFRGVGGSLVALAVKTAPYGLLIAWATKTPAGVAALSGLFAADLLVWGLWSFLVLPFRTTAVALDGMAYLVLLWALTSWTNTPLVAAPELEDPDLFLASAGAFLLTGILKSVFLCLTHYRSLLLGDELEE